MNFRKLPRLLALAPAVLLATGWSAYAADRKVYVANEGSGSVSVIDGVSLKPLTSIAVGSGAHNVQVSPDGRRVWVTNNGIPQNAAEHAAHANASAGDHGAMASAGEVWAIDTESDQVVARVAVGKHPAHVVLSPDGRLAYVTNGGDNTVSVVDTDSMKVVDTLPTGAFPHGIRLSPDGRQAYVANLKGGTVSVFDTQTKKEIDRIAVGKGPAQVGFSPDGRQAFVSLSQEGQIAFINPMDRKLVRKVRVGSVPIQLYATPDSRYLVVTNQGSRRKPGNTVSLIGLASYKNVSSIRTGAGAHGVAIGTDGRYAFVSNLYANTVSVVDVQARKTVATVPVGAEPNGITVVP